MKTFYEELFGDDTLEIIDPSSRFGQGDTIYENDHLAATVELSGFKIENIKIVYEEDYIFVNAKRQMIDGEIVNIEILIDCPFNINGKETTSFFNNGLLSIYAPYIEE